MNSSAEERRIGIDARIINSSTGTYVERLLEHLQDLDATNRYTVMIPTKDLDYWKPRSPNFSVVAADSPSYSISEQTAFLRLLQRLNFDLVHFCMPQQPVLYRGARVTTIHDLTLLKTVNRDKNAVVYRLKQVVGKLVFRHAALRSNVVICPTRHTRDEVVARWPGSGDHTVVSYEAAEIESEEISEVTLPYDRYLLYVGSHSTYKNISRLIDAHQLLLQHFPTLGLVFAGSMDGAMRITMDHVNRTGARNVMFLGRVSVAQRNYLYSRAAVYVFPSLMEGFGLPGLEAMLWSTPVASSNATCLPEVYGDAATYFDPLDTENIRDVLASVLDDEVLRQRLVSAGEQRVREFSWASMAAETHAAYMTALSDNAQ